MKVRQIVSPTLILAAMLSASGLSAQSIPDAGAYLSARSAAQAEDFAAAARSYTAALRADPDNPVLLENALTARLSLGDFPAAAALSEDLDALEVNRQIPNLVALTAAAFSADWQTVLGRLDDDRAVGPVVDGLAAAWSHLGLGQVDEALAAFDGVTQTSGLRAFGIYHKALALASIGRFEEAAQIFDLTIASDGLRHNRRSAIGHAQILAQLGKRDAALSLIDATFGSSLDDRLKDLRARIAAGDTVPFDVITGPRDGVAEIFLAVAEALNGDAPDDYILLYVRAAQHLKPDDPETLLKAAGLLEDIGRYDLANETYAAVPRSDPAYVIAELGRAAALRKDDNLDGAKEVLRGLSANFPDRAAVYVSLGDTLRAAKDMEAANAAYTDALDRYAVDDPKRWPVLYTRAITFHQLDRWPEAEADFRAALVLNPDQPQILNYLGYSLVERGEKLDEALEMIERAVAARPQNGAIVDSLGWVLFQLGQYEDAVVHLENAAALEPVDPVINDHLGDAFWAVGRKIEAEFQWNRALSLMEEDDEGVQRVRDKLAVGLDAVLAAEGASPLALAAEAE